ncbi:MAG: hypothetical protein MJZ55_01950 [Paludibacteraceae bacterium]|nr:hypothetical protein [Paludibacteraceae bacterium]
MKKTFLIAALAVTVPALACAKKPKKVAEEAPAVPVEVIEEVVEEEPTVTPECLGQVSLFSEYCKAKQYADAYGPWLEVYTNCPTANKAIYSKGGDILEWKFDNAASAEEKDQIRQLAMQMYDKRIKYFGADPKYPVPYILGQKGVAYCKYYAEVSPKLDAYKWLKESVNAMGYNSQLSVLVKLAEVSNEMYKSNPEKYADQYIADYSQVSGLLQHIWDDPASKNATAAAQQKEYVDGLFATSGAANCDKLDELYRNYVNTNGQYLEDMLKMMKLYRSVNCTESDVYFAASAAAHKLQPTEESAVGCAKMSYKKEDWKGAIDYYMEALALIAEEVDEEEDRADYQFAIASIMMDKLHRYADARSYARSSMETNPAKAGRCYLLIGMCYAASQPYSSSDYPAAKAAILNKTVFWAAVDQFQKARQYEDCAEDAAKLIASYSKYFPTKEEMFDLPGEFGSGTFIVGGWINEKTICRAAK